MADSNWDDFHLERLILKIGQQLAAVRARSLRRIDLTPAQSECLLFLGAHPPVAITTLQKGLGISHQATRMTVERLKERKLLEVRIPESDARLRLIALTSAGLRLRSRLMEEGRSAGRTLLDALTAEEKAILATLLRKTDGRLR